MCHISNSCSAHSVCAVCSDDRGRLVKATRLKGIKDFKASQYGLHPIALDTWGDMVFLNLQGGRPTAGGAAAVAEVQQSLPRVSEWLGAPEAAEISSATARHPCFALHDDLNVKRLKAHAT